MPIPYPLTFPDVPISDFRLREITTQSLDRSPTSLAQQVQDFMGGAWEGELTVKLYDTAAVLDFAGFIAALRGVYGSFVLEHPLAAIPQGQGEAAASGNITVSGAGQVGYTLATTGWDNNETNVLKRGDFVRLGSGEGSRLHRVLQNVSSDGSGDATLDIFPSLLETAPADTDRVYIESGEIYGAFRLPQDIDTEQLSPPFHGEFTIPFISVVNQ